jgi:hypothetical protein
MEFLRANLWEIKKSSTVRIFGIILSIAHVFTFLFWWQNEKLPLKLAQSPSQICWPVLESCHYLHSLSDPLLAFFFYTYIVLAVLAGIVLISSRWVGLGWFLLLLATLLKGTLYLQDFRLAANVHYLHFLFLIIWLILPSKILSFKLILAGYFVTSGIHKLSPEWLTGRWFLEHMEIPVKLAEWLAALATMIEFIAPVVLFLKDGRYFLSAFLTLFLYFSTLLYIDGFLRPALLLMFSFVFILHIFEVRRAEREFIYQSFIRPEPSLLWTLLIIVLFYGGQVLQWVPQLPKPLETTRQVLALSPLPKMNECRQSTFLIEKNRVEELMAEGEHTGNRTFTACDPYLNFLEARSFCEQKRKLPQLETVASYFFMRGLKDTSFKNVFSIDDICKPDLKYSDMGGSHGL